VQYIRASSAAQQHTLSYAEESPCYECIGAILGAILGAIQVLYRCYTRLYKFQPFNNADSNSQDPCRPVRSPGRDRTAWKGLSLIPRVLGVPPSPGSAAGGSGSGEAQSGTVQPPVDTCPDGIFASGQSLKDVVTGSFLKLQRDQRSSMYVSSGFIWPPFKHSTTLLV
jgi:hypothetical protein